MNDGDIKEFEMRVRDIDGNYHCFICRETIFRRTPDNKPHLILGTAQDITERKQAEDRIRELAIRDGLTGLYNHRQFYELLAAEMDRCKRYNRSFCLILGDLDKFKNVNDQYGHVAGDEVLRALSGFFMDHIRASDMVARYGGEEFAIIMPETPKEKAFEVADRLRDLISQCPIPISNEVDITVTISFGIACYNDLKQTDLDIFSAADKALYEAKANGRNRVCIY
jgi:diguanylate cyclase (GGDEF)-like protein